MFCDCSQQRVKALLAYITMITVCVSVL